MHGECSPSRYRLIDQPHSTINYDSMEQDFIHKALVWFKKKAQRRRGLLFKQDFVYRYRTRRKSSDRITSMMIKRSFLSFPALTRNWREYQINEILVVAWAFGKIFLWEAPNMLRESRLDFIFPRHSEWEWREMTEKYFCKLGVSCNIFFECYKRNENHIRFIIIVLSSTR